jgi:hypothetical protein
MLGLFIALDQKGLEMPRASVGMGPVRVGSGCCVAMLLVVFVFLLGLLLSSIAFASASPSTKSAVRAVEKELKNSYEIEDEEISCHRLTKTRYKCHWSKGYTTEVVEKGCNTYLGNASVIFDKYGIETNIQFINNHGARCAEL